MTSIFIFTLIKMSLNSTLLVAYLIWMIGGQIIATSMIHPIHHKAMLIVMIAVAYLISQLLGLAVLVYYRWFTEEKNRSKAFRYTFIYFIWQQYAEIQTMITISQCDQGTVIDQRNHIALESPVRVTVPCEINYGLYWWYFILPLLPFASLVVVHFSLYLYRVIKGNSYDYIPSE